MNFYAIAALINFITSVVLGVFVIYKSRKAKNISFFIFCFFAAFWSFGYYFWQISTDSETALFWTRVLMAGAIFISVAYLHFVYALVEILDKRKKFLIFSYLLFFIFFLTNFTPYFVSHTEPLLNFKFWPIAGPLYSLFLVIWVFYAYYSAFVLLRFYKNSHGILKSQLKYIIIGTIIGYTGGITNYFLWYRILIPPFGNIAASFYLLCVAYAVIKYRLMDIRVVARKVVIYFISAGFVYGIFFFSAWIFNEYFGGVFTPTAYLSGLVIAPLCVAAFLWFFDFIQKIANKYLFFSLYNYQTTINDLSQKLNYLNDLNEIVNLIVDTVKQTIQLDRTGVLLIEEDRGIKYRIAKVIGFNEKNGISLVQDDFLTKHLKETQKPLVQEELALLARDAKSEDRRKGFLELESNMRRIEASLCLPLMSSKKLIGIVVLGSKISGDAYAKEDLELLNTLAFQAGIAIDNARLYKEIHDLNQGLRQKVDEQTKEIRKAYKVEKEAHKELKRLDAAKDQFIMATQHHLRTPLTSMRGYLDLIFGGSYGRVPEKLKEVLKKFESSTKNEIQIVNELLDISQFQLGKEVIKLQTNIEIEPIIKEIIEEIKFEVEKKTLYLRIKKPKGDVPSIKADSQKLKIALSNIVDNSIKYTQEGGVTIKLQTKDNRLQIIIQDTGMGIPKKELPLLFSRTFERGKGAAKFWGPGKGIGLFLASNIIKLHNGRIWADSEGLGKGSTFFVELPIG